MIYLLILSVTDIFFMQNITLYRRTLACANWHKQQQDIPTYVFPWLAENGSLTQKLQHICRQLEVEVIQQGWINASPDNPKTSSKITALNEPYWLREVLIKGDGDPWIFAQTRLPKSTVEQVASDVLTLGNSAIGLWLFPQQPKRQDLTWSQDPQSGLFARSSSLLLQQYPLEIQELFLSHFSFP